MSKEQDKKEKHNKLKPSNRNQISSGFETYDKICEEFYQFQKMKLKNAKQTIKNLNEKLRKLQITNKEEADKNKELSLSMLEKEEALTQAIEIQNKATLELKAMTSKCLEDEKKYANLEISYDRNVTQLNLDMTELKQKLEVQTTANAELTKKFAISYDEMKVENLKKTEIIAEQSLEIEKLRSAVKLCEENYKTQTLELETKCDEIGLKNEEVTKLKLEKNQLKIKKNNKIRELNAKLAAVNRVIAQEKHVQLVSPTRNKPSNLSENQNEPNVDTSHHDLSISNVSILSRQNTSVRQTVQERANSSMASHVSSQTVRHSSHSKIVNNEFNTDSESDTDISIFRPDPHNIPVIPQVRGFGRLKRAYQEDIIPESSESENNFDRIKRTK